MKRFLALLVAAGLIGGAVLVRRAIDDDGDGGSNGNGSNGGGDGVLTLACIPELEAVCDALSADVDEVEIRVEDASATVEALATGGGDDLDGWLTFAPWPEIAGIQAAGRDVIGDERAVGVTQLAIVVWGDRRAALEATVCPDGVDWRCLGDASGQSFAAIGATDVPGTVKVGHAPTDSAEGRLVLGNAVAGYFGRTDIGTNDFSADDGFQSWIRRLEREIGERDPLLTMLRQGRGAYSAVGTTTAHVERRAGAQLDELDILYPAPVTVVPVVLVAVTGGDGDVLDLADERALRDGILSERFGSVEDDEVPAPEGMPPAGTLVALAET